MDISVIIPAYNEEKTIVQVIQGVNEFAKEVIVIDDTSTDNTKEIAESCGAIVYTNKENLRYSKSVEKGINLASSDWILTIDADGEHEPSDIPNAIALADSRKIIIGKRPKIPRKGERVISSFTKEYYGFEDALCGFRLFHKSIIAELIPFSTDDNFGLSFLIDAVNKGYPILNCDLSYIPPRKEPRIGNDIEERLKDILRNVLDK
jgi:polyprenyl-phospho-N-acetylgalactosaminyl synthase